MANKSEDMSSCSAEYSPTQPFYYKNNKPCFQRSYTFRNHHVNIKFLQIYRVIQVERSIMWEVTVTVDVKRKVIWTRVYFRMVTEIPLIWIRKYKSIVNA